MLIWLIIRTCYLIDFSYFLISVFWERFFLSRCIWVYLTRSIFMSWCFEKVIELLLNLNFDLVLFFLLVFGFVLNGLILFIFEFNELFFEWVIFLLKFWIFLENLGEFTWRLKEFFLVIFRIWRILRVDLMFEYLNSFLIIINFLMETHYLEFKLLILMIVFLDKDFGCFDSILSVETFRF